MDNDASVTMSLFDAQAVKIHNQLEQMGVDPRVFVATSVNPKIVGGRLFLNATSGTHIYFDKETDAGERLFFRLVEQDTGLPPVAPLLKSYAKVEKLSITELNDFVLSAASQGGDDDNGDDNKDAGLVSRKMDGGGCSKSGKASAKSKKARKA
ncbi:hypothetical protein Bca52824_065822 [Brassica carinata]|uniref:Uncharacterized protein n=1 Tax=Brassica carinata TaxID=52824 RepID=A0A8X7QJG2_BRACI|nr:hypothetical protein Bca52824_065822 [Brassica carinata]